jgi:hypothetical protein
MTCLVRRAAFLLFLVFLQAFMFGKVSMSVVLLTAPGALLYLIRSLATSALVVSPPAYQNEFDFALTETIFLPTGRERWNLLPTALLILGIWIYNHVSGGRRVSPAMQREVTVVPETFGASVDPDTFASLDVQVLPGGADRERAPVTPAGLIGAAATGCKGDTFEETAVHSADESTLRLEQTPCNVAEVVFEPSWIHVRKLNGEILLSVEVEAGPTSVSDLKSKLFVATGIQPYRQELFRDGEQEPLVDSETLAALRPPGTSLDRTLSVIGWDSECSSDISMDVNVPGFANGQIFP